MIDPWKVYYSSRNHTYFTLKHYPLDMGKLWGNYATDLWLSAKWLRPNRQLPGRAWLIAVSMAGKITGTGAALASSRVRAAWRRRR